MAFSGAQHRRRDRILIQAEPAKIQESVDAVVLKHGRLHEHRLDVVRPRLPAWLEIRDLGVGTASADLRFERGRDGRAAVEAKVKAGPLTVVPTETSPPGDFTATAAA